MEKRFAQLFHIYIRCAPPGCLCHLWVLLADHHAMAFAIPGCIDSLALGPCCRRTVLRIPRHIATRGLHLDRRHLQ